MHPGIPVSPAGVALDSPSENSPTVQVVDGIRTRIQEVVDKEYANSSCEGINSDAYHVWAAHDYWAMPWFDYLQELIAANESTS